MYLQKYLISRVDKIPMLRAARPPEVVAIPVNNYKNILECHLSDTSSLTGCSDATI
jgi:hypothetical protein